MILDQLPFSIDMRGKNRLLALSLMVSLMVSCVGGPETKNTVAAPQSPVSSVSGDTPAAQPPNPASTATQPEAVEVKSRLDFTPPHQESALVKPVPAMPPVPGERSEKDMLADADKRSEVMKPQIQAAIAAVVPGPYPEIKKPEKEAPPVAKEGVQAKPVGTQIAGASGQPLKSAAPQFPTPAPARAPEKAITQVAEQQAARSQPQIVAPVEGVPDLTLVNKFTMADGLPSNLITALYVDESEAWVGTSGGGIARYVFSENHWIVTGTTGGLTSDFVTDVVKYKGKVFVGTKTGISIWDGFDWSSMSELEQVQLGNVTFALKEGELWAAARNMRGGVLSYDGNKWVDRSTMRQGLILNNVSDFAFDGGDIWLGTTSRGVYMKRGKDWKVFSVTDGIASNFIYTMAVKGGKCYLGGCCGVSYFDGEKWVIYDVPEGLPHSTVNSIVWDASGIVWLGSKNGLAGFDGTSFRNFYVDDGLLPDNHVTSLFVKGEDVWVGTIGGISHLQKSQ